MQQLLNYSNLKKDIAARVYYCSEGYPTIGIGKKIGSPTNSRCLILH